MSLQDGNGVFRVGGGKSLLIGSSSNDVTNSFQLIPHSREGMEVLSSNKGYSEVIMMNWFLQSKNKMHSYS